MRYHHYLRFVLILGLAVGACSTTDSGSEIGADSDTAAGEAADSGADAGSVDDTTDDNPCPDGTLDECGVCDGDNTTCAGCDGVPNSGAVEDECGVCDGDNTTCAGCDGVPNSGAVEDACGVCDGDGSTCGPLTDASVLIGRPFLVNLSDATWVQPAGADMLVGSQLETLGIVMATLPESDLENGMMHAVVVGAQKAPPADGSEDGEPELTQDLCSPTPIATAGEDQLIGTEDDIGGTWSDPRIEVGPSNLTVYAQGQGVTATSVMMSGVFSEDGLELSNGRLEGKLDVRSAAESAGMSGEQICQSAGMMGIVCSECGGSDPGVYCIDVLVEDVTSTALELFEYQVRTCVDILADEACADNIPTICN